jgi:hypothetical protein
MGVQYPSNSPGTVLFLKVIKKLEANVFKFLDYPKMSFVSQPGRATELACRRFPPLAWDGRPCLLIDASQILPPR